MILVITHPLPPPSPTPYHPLPPTIPYHPLPSPTSDHIITWGQQDGQVEAFGQENGEVDQRDDHEEHLSYNGDTP